MQMRWFYAHAQKHGGNTEKNCDLYFFLGLPDVKDFF